MRKGALKTDLRLVSVEKEGEPIQTSNLKPRGVYNPALSKEEVENLSAFFEILNRINEREKLC